MKKLIFSVLSVLLFTTLTGCKRNITPKKDPATIENVCKIGKFVKKIDLNFDTTAFKKALNEALDKVYDAKSYDDAYEALNTIVYKVNELSKKYSVSEALVSYDMSDKEIVEKNKILRDAYLDYSSFYYKMIVELSKNDEYLQLFFAGYDQEDIDFEVDMAKKKIDEKYVSLTKEIDDLKDKANEIGIDLNSKTRDDELLDVMIEYIAKNKELAELMGFDSYVEFADLEWNRSYLESDVKDFIKYTKEYIVPLMDDNNSVIDVKKSFSSLTVPQQNYYKEFSYTSIFDKDYNTINLLKDYSKKMGGSYFTTFAKFLDDGHYVFASNDSSLSGAYTYGYSTYFGPGYQNCTSVAHEFGHYYSQTNSFLNAKSLDLQEFFSQANEYLFTSYLEQNSKSNVTPVYNVRSKEMVDKAAYNIVIASALREFEEEIYSKTITDKNDITEIWNNINNNNYEGKLSAYWKAEIRYDLYYISYATSVTGAVGLYNMSKTNLNQAINAYIKAANNQDIYDDIERILDKVGLYSPFSENAFKEIVKTLEEKR